MNNKILILIASLKCKRKQAKLIFNLYKTFQAIVYLIMEWSYILSWEVRYFVYICAYKYFIFVFHINLVILQVLVTLNNVDLEFTVFITPEFFVGLYSQ